MEEFFDQFYKFEISIDTKNKTNNKMDVVVDDDVVGI